MHLIVTIWKLPLGQRLLLRSSTERGHNFRTQTSGPNFRWDSQPSESSSPWDRFVASQKERKKNNILKFLRVNMSKMFFETTTYHQKFEWDRIPTGFPWPRKLLAKPAMIHTLTNGGEGRMFLGWKNPAHWWMEFHLKVAFFFFGFWKLVSWRNLINAGEATQEMAAGLLPVEAPKARAQQEVVNCVNSWICPSFSKTSTNKKMNCNTRNLYSTFSLSKSLVKHLRSWSQ